VALRVVLTVFAVALLAIPWLKLAGGALLIWIGIKLLAPRRTTSRFRRTRDCGRPSRPGSASSVSC
jgi:threonine/homoserine/homoserine lactone efflux protein